MTPPTLNSMDREVIESVLKMSGGYVLDFSDRTFAEFFGDFGVRIDDEAFRAQGTSKANRLRVFLKVAQPAVAGRVLAALLERRFVKDPEGLKTAEVDHYGKLVARLAGESAAPGKAKASIAETEADLLRRVFRPELFASLPIDTAMSRALVARMEEAHRCIGVQANLAAVILCGSVLEGMCLGFGCRHPARVNRAYAERYNKSPDKFHRWKPREWIEVLGSLGDLSPNIEKFGHALRDFRNYVHPAEQLAHHFTPDQHTARIGFQVVVAAADDLVRAETVIAGEATP